jgi:hypothetical protein
MTRFNASGNPRYSKRDRVFQTEVEYAEPPRRQEIEDGFMDVHHLDYLEMTEHVERELQAALEFDESMDELNSCGFDSIDDLCPNDHSRICFMR